MFNQKWKIKITWLLLFILGLFTTISLYAIQKQPALAALTEEDWNILLEKQAITEIVDTIEKTWEAAYENHFNANLSDFGLNAEAIAKTLHLLTYQNEKKSAVVWVWPRKEQLQLLLITPNQLPIVRSVINAEQDTVLNTVKKLTQEITSPRKRQTNSYLKPAQQMYQWIVAPIESELEKQEIDTVLFCLGPGLRSLALAALHDGQNFLIEKYSVARIPAFNLISTDYNRIKNSRVLAMGASEFVDQEPLPAVPIELKQITEKLWQGEAFINQDFTVKNLQEQRQKQDFSIIHLATHADFNSGQPSNSYIQFWNHEKLELDDIRKMKWYQPEVELLVLSACKTAVGDIEAELGFAGLTVQSGVKSALASLWYVSDVGTLALIDEFYQHLQKIIIKAEALQQAQIAMLKGKVNVENGELHGSGRGVKLPPELANLGDENLSHPYYWAAFTIIGNPW
ncbi:MAG: CHAT domain-containing protein [Microcoleaceae cyanobacterium MO_207.B10]|nr:CHAT domain-containing protein [Microcoleaceae cyanobacterium MO_207.B10]